MGFSARVMCPRHPDRRGDRCSACVRAASRVQEGYWSWISGVLDTALYPLLAADMVLDATDVDAGVVFMFKLAFVVVLSVPNLLGLKVVDSVLVALGLAVLIPFAVLVVLGIPQMGFGNLLQSRSVADMDFGRLLNILVRTQWFEQQGLVVACSRMTTSQLNLVGLTAVLELQRLHRCWACGWRSARPQRNHSQGNGLCRRRDCTDVSTSLDCRSRSGSTTLAGVD